MASRRSIAVPALARDKRFRVDPKAGARPPVLPTGYRVHRDGDAAARLGPAPSAPKAAKAYVEGARSAVAGSAAHEGTDEAAARAHAVEASKKHPAHRFEVRSVFPGGHERSIAAFVGGVEVPVA